MHQREEVEMSLRKMLDQGVIEPSTSPWASPIMLVKKDGSTRFCIDYWNINDITWEDAYPLAHMNEIVDAFAWAKYFSTFDLGSGYWQVELDQQEVRIHNSPWPVQV